MKPAPYMSPQSYGAQPKIVTAAEAAKVLGWADSSVSAVVSRLEQQGAEI